MLDDTTNQPSKFRKRNLVEINDILKRKHDSSNITFKTSITRSHLCDYSDAYILVKGIITIPNTAAPGGAVNNTNKKIIFKNCAPFTNCITEINNTHVDDAQYIDIMMPMHNLIEYSDAYLKTLGGLWQYCRDEPALGANNNIIDFPANKNNSISFGLKQQITGQTWNGDTKGVEIMLSLSYLSNVWRTLEMSLINCEISLQLKWSKKCVAVAGSKSIFWNNW